jgi:hypothetical protein
MITLVLHKSISGVMPTFLKNILFFVSIGTDTVWAFIFLNAINNQW